MAKEEPKNVGKIRKHLGFLKNEDAVLFEFNFFIANKMRNNHLYDFFRDASACLLTHPPWKTFYSQTSNR